MLVSKERLRLDFRLAEMKKDTDIFLASILFTNLDKKVYDTHYFLESTSWFASDSTNKNYPSSYIIDIKDHKVYSLFEENYPYDSSRYFLREILFKELPQYIQDAIVQYYLEEKVD